MNAILSDFTLGSILLGAALVLVVVLFLARPFAGHKTGRDGDAGEQRDEVDGLFLRKEAILHQIRELDDDFETAKIAPELYRRARPELVTQAALLMKQIDEPNPAPATALSGEIDRQIEATVRQMRARSGRQPTLEDGAAATLCPQCLNPVGTGDRFCSQCGHILIPEPQAAGATGN